MDFALGALVGIISGTVMGAVIALAAIAYAHLRDVEKPQPEKRPRGSTKTGTKFAKQSTTTTTPGFIIEPESEADEARSELIERNKKRGVDTPLTDLEYEDS